MKPIYEQITSRMESSLTVLQLNLDCFDTVYHFHPEIELTYIKSSYGKRYLGGKVTDYEPGDLVLVGPDVPHCWHSYDAPLPTMAQAIVIQFRTDFAGDGFLQLPESSKIGQLFEKARAGLLISGNLKTIISAKMELMVSSDGFARLLVLMEILHLIANSDEIQPIDSESGLFISSSAETVRFQKVFAFLIENYHQEISLKTISGIANLTPTAFCRYFKNVTRKTLVEVITEFRLSKAMQLLRNTDKPVNEVCFLSGFGNISYFNKTFKSANGNSPMEYRKLFQISR
ncbi:MAG: AraC family transcriptional regulator [Prolixibacteraceae bacterium]|nr:AraC family transcriptional regulator [Prolixibacteraceae bacterium]